jgi:hypothetical protein
MSVTSLGNEPHDLQACSAVAQPAGGKIVTLTHRPSLPPGVFLVLIFRGWVDPRAHGSVGSFGKNPQWHHWGFFFGCLSVLHLYFFVLIVLTFAFCPYCRTFTTQTSMPPAGFESAVPASDRPETLALDHSVIGIGLGIDPEALCLVAQCLNRYPTPGPTC